MREQKIEIDQTLHAEFDALRARVAINAGKPEEAERLATEALKFLPLSSYYSRIVATSVTGEVHHCKGELARALPMMQQTEQMARRHQANHYALWALLQQSEIAYRPRLPAGRLRNQGQGVRTDPRAARNSCRCTNFCCASRPDPVVMVTVGRSGRRGARRAENSGQLPTAAAAAVHRHVGQMLAGARRSGQCQYSPAALRNPAGAHYHRDWLTNTDESRVIHWQMTGDTAAAAQWLRHRKPGMADNHFTQGQWRNIARVQILLGQYDEAGVVLDELNENARRLRLVSDLNRNLLLSNQLYWLQERRAKRSRR